MMFTPTSGQPQAGILGFHPGWASLFPGMSSYYQRLAHAAPAKKPGFLVADLLFTNSVSRNSERSMAVVMPSRCRTSSHSPEVEDLSHAPRSSELKFGIDRILQDSDKNDTKEDKETGAAPVTALGCSCHSPASPSISCTQPAFHHVALSSSSTSRYHLPVPSMHTVLYPLPKTLLHTESSSSQNGNTSPPQQPKRKRSWSRAVFSNLQRKGLEKRFEVQKYVTKPDRRQLAAMLGLTDAQVKVWFQNRRMKWRHAQEAERRKREEESVVKEAESKNPETNDLEEDIVIDSDDPDPNMERAQDTRNS